ncbi:PilZ domain-containing protein [Neptuniibacter sp. 2_MG-2023]|uniref:PilZ domain-containing protein n=1 Tax=Neptuniibacter sp. 2_MG-2023 TaxID=3062671 RepID=UPI0026E3F7E3|nr:PilZ domain-containing protein [Neptuniibacter sp. 2_MG-2023]MDO6515047.1 PilZ domain-containing protein [Neptuniibacter sp. 2_MG-2023]
MDRRTYPRIDTDLPAEVQMFAGSSIDVRLINLSLGGMLVEGGKEVELLRPLVDGAPLELSLHFGLNQNLYTVIVEWFISVDNPKAVYSWDCPC